MVRTYIEQVLAPTLHPGDIVILDDLGSHKVAGVRAAIAPFVIDGPINGAAPVCSTCRPLRQIRI
jgi:hypothetical protein